jgi:AI-2 transport protein TqsA
MSTQSYITPGLRFLLTAACLVIVIAGMRAASAILVPLALALFVAVASLPLLNIARRKGIPTSVAILLVVVLDGVALFVFGWLMRLTSLEISSEYAMYLVRLQELEVSTIAWFAERGIEIVPPSELWLPAAATEDQVATSASPNYGWLLSLASSLARWATDMVTTVFLVVLIFIFMLAEATHFGRKLRLIVGRDRVSRSAKMVSEIQHFLAIKTFISAITGLTIGVATWAIGLDFALLWGLLAFLLNYIPNVGSIVAAIPAILIALLQLGPGAALLTTIVYIAVNALFGNFLDPMLMGRQLGISTLVVILGLVFWGWVWGPVGMFLSVPLTVALKIGLENSAEFRWLAILMASDGLSQPTPAGAGSAGVANRIAKPGAAESGMAPLARSGTDPDPV